jgi:hypothetical protein
VNIRRNINWKAVLGLGLFTALAGGGLLVGRRNQATDASAPAPEQMPGQSPAAVQPVIHRASPESSALQPATIPTPDELRTMSPVLNESGYEAPFSGTNQAPVSTSATQTDPAKLRTALADASSAGNVRELADLP